MKAALLTEWNQIEIRDIPKPEPQDDQLLIKMIYAGVCGSDVTVYSGKHPTATIPRILCHEIFGVVEKIGMNCRKAFRAGDRVVVYPLISCNKCEACREGNFHVCRSLGLNGIHADGGFAEYFIADAEKVFMMPDVIPDRIAALTEPFAVGFHVNSRAGTRHGDSVFIIGGGPIGIICGIVAKEFGASRVVFSEINKQRLENLQSFGFETIDPGKEDLTARISELSGGQGFDRVFEASGTQAGASLVASACKIRGTIIPVGIPTEPRSYETGKIIFKELSLIGSRVYSHDHFRRTIGLLKDLCNNGRYDLERIIDREMPLYHLTDAFGLMLSGKNTGKILIRF